MILVLTKGVFSDLVNYHLYYFSLLLGIDTLDLS